ncbi:hypothetical protein ACH4S8_37475 [Streptomyces sp. NPDC021080]|uniref:hypothetical protein n=1 Tax=Streptomyces sp. NPDC021080 TaxID=3365110 RepID=UPI00379EE518
MTDRFWLRPFGGEPEGRCPKCLVRPTITEYHDTVVAGMCQDKRAVAVAMADDPADIPDETTEHLCRACTSCGFEWCERPATAEDMARVKAGLVIHAE